MGSAQCASPSAHLVGAENRRRGTRLAQGSFTPRRMGALARALPGTPRPGRPDGPRATALRPSPAPRAAPGARDISDPELWEISRARSMRRHEAEDQTFETPARSASIAALLLVTGGSATAIASTLGRRQGRRRGAHGGDKRRRPRQGETPARAAQPAPCGAACRRAEVRTAAAVAPPRAARRRGRAPACARSRRGRQLRARDQAGPQGLAAGHGLDRRRRGGPQTRAALDLGAGPVMKWPRPCAEPPGPRRRSPHAHRPTITRGRARAAASRRSSRHSACPRTACSAPAPSGARSAGRAPTGSPPTAWPGRPRGRRSDGRRSGAQAQGRQPRSLVGRRGRGGSSSTVARVVAAANAIAGEPYVYGGGPRLVRVRGLRLLRLGLLRPPRRRAPLVAARLERVHELRRRRSRPAHHDLRQPRPRVHGHRRSPLRHQRPLRDGLPLDGHEPLGGRVRGAASPRAY